MFKVILFHVCKKIFEFIYNTFCLKVIHTDIHHAHKCRKKHTGDTDKKDELCNDKVSVRPLVHKINSGRNSKYREQVKQHLKHHIRRTAAERVLVCQIGIAGNCFVKRFKRFNRASKDFDNLHTADIFNCFGIHPFQRRLILPHKIFIAHHKHHLRTTDKSNGKQQKTEFYIDCKYNDKHKNRCKQCGNIIGN